MIKLFLAFAASFLFVVSLPPSCTTVEKVPPVVPCNFAADSIRVADEYITHYEALLDLAENEKIKLEAERDSLLDIKRPVLIKENKRQTDSLRSALQVARFKLERVRFYLNICLRNPTQDRFLKGWIRRAIE